jgi:DNA replication protein DnaC
MTPQDVVERTGKFAPQIDMWLDQVLEGKVIKSIGGLGTTGVGLLFDGDPGLGKTTHAVLSLLEFVRRLPDDRDVANSILKYEQGEYGFDARPVYYMTFPDFLHRKKAMIDASPDSRRTMQLEMDGLHGRAVDDYLNVRLLVLDDLGKEYGSDYNVAGFDEVLRSRYDKALPTIITTNTARDKWGQKYGDAMGSFVYEAFKRVIIGEKDLRRTR